MYLIARTERGIRAAGKVVAFDAESDTVTFEFSNALHVVHITSVFRVRDNMSEIASSTGSQAEAVQRVRDALIEFRKTRNGVDSKPSKPPRNRYASLDVHIAPSPTHNAPVLAPPEAALPKPARRAAPKTAAAPPAAAVPAVPGVSKRPAQRLYNDRLEIFFPADTTVTAKLPKGQIDNVVTDKPFGKIFKRT